MPPARAGRQRPGFLVAHKVLESGALPTGRPLRPIAGSLAAEKGLAHIFRLLWDFENGPPCGLFFGVSAEHGPWAPSVSECTLGRCSPQKGVDWSGRQGLYPSPWCPRVREVRSVHAGTLLTLSRTRRAETNGASRIHTGASWTRSRSRCGIPFPHMTNNF